jgi:hypothetical protein
MIETGVTITRTLGSLGIDFLEIFKDRMDRFEKTVEIDAIKTGWRLAWSKLVVVLAQPSDEVEHIGVPPHPRRKAFEA